jgi:uncharacterized protein YbaA (DUF1428 family)
MEQKFGTKIKNASAETKDPITAEIETGGYMDLSFSRASKKNHDAMEQIGKPFVQWLKKHEVRTEIYYLNSTATNEVPPEGLESIAKTLSIDDNEEVWVSLQFYRDRAHVDEVHAKMMQDESIGKLMKEFDGLVTQGKSLITDGFSRLKA